MHYWPAKTCSAMRFPCGLIASRLALIPGRKRSFYTPLRLRPISSSVSFQNGHQDRISQNCWYELHITVISGLLFNFPISTGLFYIDNNKVFTKLFILIFFRKTGKAVPYMHNIKISFCYFYNFFTFLHSFCQSNTYFQSQYYCLEVSKQPQIDSFFKPMENWGGSKRWKIHKYIQGPPSQTVWIHE